MVYESDMLVVTKPVVDTAELMLNNLQGLFPIKYTKEIQAQAILKSLISSVKI